MEQRGQRRFRLIGIKPGWAKKGVGKRRCQKCQDQSGAKGMHLGRVHRRIDHARRHRIDATALVRVLERQRPSDRRTAEAEQREAP